MSDNKLLASAFRKMLAEQGMPFDYLRIDGPDHPDPWLYLEVNGVEIPPEEAEVILRLRQEAEST